MSKIEIRKKGFWDFWEYYRYTSSMFLNISPIFMRWNHDKKVVYYDQQKCVWGISELIISIFFQPWWSYSLSSIKILHFWGISELRVSKFSSTMVKSIKLVHENPSLCGHFRTMNSKNFFNHGEIFHTSPWKSFTSGAFQD